MKHFQFGGLDENGPIPWSPPSFDITPLDYLVYRTKVTDNTDLKSVHHWHC
ncbi:unnamed protein product [Larinioides sclopetarius]|uniref:Uncharacterized protein n=1 Tax=Larinioides sclopetarius TaxID=280406 RepID=A0AAV2B7E3_9ARAC